jgi:uncharacterized protein (DUF1499 family)
MIAVYIIAGLLAFMIISSAIQNNRTPGNLGIGDDGRLAPMPGSPNAVSSQTDQADKLVEPLPMLGDAKASLDALEAIAGKHGAKIVSRRDNYLHAVYITPGMKFKDDVEYLAAGDVIHFRSASRTGYGDMGVNRKRYEQIKAEYLAAGID